MAFFNSTKLFANKALGRMSALASQAKSYTTHPAMLRARGIASQLTKPALIGGGAGFVGGASYDRLMNDQASVRSTLSSGIRGGLLGAAGGMGYYGMRQAGGMGSFMNKAKGGIGRTAIGLSNKMNNLADRIGPLK